MGLSKLRDKFASAISLGVIFSIVVAVEGCMERDLKKSECHSQDREMSLLLQSAMTSPNQRILDEAVEKARLFIRTANSETEGVWGARRCPAFQTRNTLSIIP